MLKQQSFIAEFAIRILIPSMFAACGIAALLFYIVSAIFDETNRLDAEYSRRSALAAVSTIRENLEAVIQDNAVWDEAVDNSYGTANREWLDGMWGTGTEGGVYDTAFVIDADGQTVYGAHRGKRFDKPAVSYLGGDIAVLIGKLPRDGVTFGKTSGLADTDGKLSMVTAAVILPSSPGLRIPDRLPRYLVMAKKVDDNLLSLLSSRLALDNLNVTIGRDKPHGTAVPVMSPSGKQIGTLSWNNRSPGTVLRAKYSNVIGIVLLMFLFVIGILIYTSWRGFREARSSQAEAVAASMRDDLTGLANRRELLSVLRSCLANAKETGGKLSVVYADLDGFKEVNDSYGHEIGDLLLKSAAAGFAHLAQGTDLVSRLGGDEFAIIATGPD